MKKFYALALSLLFFLVGSSELHAGHGIFNHNIQVNDGVTFVNGNSGSFDGTSFGSVTQLTLEGGFLNTYQNGSDAMCGGSIFWQVFPSSSTANPAGFNEYILNYVSENPGGSGGIDKFWQTISPVDLLSGLAPGDYVLQVFWRAQGDWDGNCSPSDNNINDYISNSPNDYQATFTVPCPTCDDGNACTTDSCVPYVGCVYNSVVDGTPCDDGDPLTINDVCNAGSCSGTAVSGTVPTLGQWGLILFGLLLLCSGAIVMWRRQYTFKKERA